MLIKYAKVTSVNGIDFRVTFLGDSEQSTNKYFRLKNYTPQLNDTVAFIKDSKNKYLCLGTVE